MIENGNQVRIINIPDMGSWYVARDIADALGYKDQTQAIKINCEHSVRLCDIFSSVSHTVLNEIKGLSEGWSPTSLLIQRSDVHRLIVAAKRTKEEAAKFEKWIFDDVLENISENGSYSLVNSQISNNQFLELQNRMVSVLERMETKFDKMEERFDSITSHLIKSNQTLVEAVSKFNQTLATVKFQTAMSTAFAVEKYIPLEKFVEITKDLVVLDIRANFNEVNLRIYLNKNVSEKERIFKTNGEPYDKFITGGHYRVDSSQTTKVYITRAGAEYLYLFLKTKRIFE